DNLFWHNRFKDINMALFRAVGWNVGTLREIGGGVKELIKSPYSLAKEFHRRGKMSTRQMRSMYAEGGGLPVDPRAAYVVALGATVMVTSKIIEALVYNQGMPEFTDPTTWDGFVKNFMIKTGRKNPDGQDEYIVLASYLKDVISMISSGAPQKTIIHKLGPVWQALGELITNRDFYGKRIIETDPTDNYAYRVMIGAGQTAKHFGEVSLPFTLANAQRRSLSMPRDILAWGVAPIAMIESTLGTTPATVASVRSRAVNYARSEASAGSPAGPFKRIDIEKRNKRAYARALVGTGGTAKELLDYIRENQIPLSVAKEIWKQSKMSPIKKAAMDVPLASIKTFWTLCTDAEKAEAKPVLAKRLNKSK
ncbi:MAG: hypothetical protein ACWGQW_24760, partial [bacterium]